MQEASSRRKVAELQQLLQSNKTPLADFQKDLLKREKEPVDLKSKGTGAAQVKGLYVYNTEYQLQLSFILASFF